MLEQEFSTSLLQDLGFKGPIYSVKYILAKYEDVQNWELNGITVTIYMFITRIEINSQVVTNILMTNHLDLELFLRAVADQMLLPLCFRMKWAQPFIEQLVKGKNGI